MPATTAQPRSPPVSPSSILSRSASLCPIRSPVSPARPVRLPRPWRCRRAGGSGRRPCGRQRRPLPRSCPRPRRARSARPPTRVGARAQRGGHRLVDQADVEVPAAERSCGDERLSLDHRGTARDAQDRPSPQGACVESRGAGTSGASRSRHEDPRRPRRAAGGGPPRLPARAPRADRRRSRRPRPCPRDGARRCPRARRRPGRGRARARGSSRCPGRRRLLTPHPCSDPPGGADVVAGCHRRMPPRQYRYGDTHRRGDVAGGGCGGTALPERARRGGLTPAGSSGQRRPRR